MKRLLFLAQLLLVGFGEADGVREPAGVGGEGGLLAEGCGLRRTRRHLDRPEGLRHDCAVADARDAQLVLAVGPVDTVDEPPAIRRERAGRRRARVCDEPFPLTVVRRRGGRLLLRVDGQNRRQRQKPDAEWQAMHTPSVSSNQF